MMAEWFSGDIVANDIKIHYHRTGGDKPPMVLAHGATDNGLCWTRLARALQVDYDIIMPDARGHGLSDAPAHGYAASDHAGDLASLIRALQLDKPALIGHSMGAAAVAATAADYPRLVRCVILEDPPWWAEGTAPSLETRAASGQAWRKRLLDQQEKSINQIIAAARSERPAWTDVEWIPWAQSKKQVSLFMFRELGVSQEPWQSVLRRISCPVLLITGDQLPGRFDAIITPETAAEASRILRKGEIVHIGEAGHSIRREQFEAYLAAVRKFLQEVF